MSTIKCPIQPEQPKENQLPGSAIAARLRGHYDELMGRAGILTDGQVIELKLQREFSVKALATAHIPLLKNYNKLESILAKDLGWKSWLWQALTGGMTDAGAVRYALRDKQKLAAGLIQTAAQFKILPDVRNLYGELKRALPGMKEVDLQEILYDHVVIGNYPKLYNVMDSPVVRDQLMGRYNKHVQKLVEMGVSGETIKTLDTLSGRISEAFDTLRNLAGREGLDIPVLMNGGYFPIRAQEEARRYFDALAEGSGIGKKQAYIDLEEFFTKSRVSNVPLALKTDELAQHLGMTELDLIDLVKEPGMLSAKLNEKLSPQQIEKLFESGVLVQTPALSDELTEFFNESLDLPLKNLGEAIMLDPVKAIEDYTKQLKTTVETSSLVKDLFTNGIENGWIVDPAFVGNRNTKDYVRLGSSKLLMDVIPSTGLREQVADLFVHRTVADQMNSILAINQSWADLGVIGQTIQKFVVPYTNVFRKMALLGTPVQYLKRVVSQDLIAVHAAVGHLGQVGIATAEVFRMRRFDNMNVFGSATVKIGGKEMKLQDVFEATFMKRGGDFLTSMGENLETIKSPFQFLSPQSFQRFMMFNKAYHARFGSPITGKIGAAVDVVKEMSDRPFKAAYAFLADANQHADIAARWAAIRTLAVEQGDRFANLDELIRYTDDYFQINEDVGSFGKLYGSVGMPFASFAMAAPGSALRFTLQHPWRAGRMLSLYAQASSGQQLTDAEMKQWQKDDYVISVAHDPNTGKQYSVSPTSVDFYLSSYTYFRELAEDVGRSMGLQVGSVEEQVQQEKNPLQPLTDMLQNAAKDTYFSALFPLFGIDPQTMETYKNAEQTDTLIGVPMPKALRDSAMRIFPLLRSADEKWLPPQIVGQARKVSPSFDVQQEAQPGWLGRTPTQGGARDRFQPDAGTLAWFLNNGAGLTLSEIDPERNLVSTYNDFNERQSELSTTINRINKRLLVEASSLTPTDKEALVDQRENFLRMRFLLKYNQFLVDKIATERGLAKPSVLNQLQQKLGRFTAPAKLDDAKAFVREYIGETSYHGNSSNQK
jgi:hypothetical protein